MKISHPALHGLALSVPLALSLLVPASAQSYNFTDFDASGSGLATTVNGISNSGVTVGYFSVLNADGTTTNTSFAGTPGAITTLDLSTLAMPDAAGAYAINSSGQIVGSDGSGGAFVMNGTGGVPQALPIIDPAKGSSESAYGISDTGVIVGQVIHDDGSASGFVDASGTFTSLDPAGVVTNTSAQGINGNGLVIGFYATPDNLVLTHGFSFNTLTNAYTTFADPTVSDLAFTQFLGINKSGEAVGYYQTGAGLQHGFLYNTSTSAYTFLDDPNVALDGSAAMQITGITDSGEIAGFYTNADGATLGFVATPAAVPEASSVVSLSLLLMLGVGGVVVAKRRKLAA